MSTDSSKSAVDELNSFYASQERMRTFHSGSYMERRNRNLEKTMERVRENQTEIDQLMAKVAQLTTETETSKAVRVFEDFDDEFNVMLPLCPHSGCLKNSVLLAAFPGATSITFKVEGSEVLRIHCADRFGLIAPPGNGWESAQICAFYDDDEEEDEEN